MKAVFQADKKLPYFLAQSSRPSHMREGVVRDEAVRLLRNSASKVNWLVALSEVFKCLLRRGYSPRVIKAQWQQVRFYDRAGYTDTTANRVCAGGRSILTSFHPLTSAYCLRILSTLPVRVQERDLVQSKGQDNP